MNSSFSRNPMMHLYLKIGTARTKSPINIKNLLLDLCGSQNHLILNGRTIGDSAGRYTCYKWNGNNVVDYFIASKSFLRRVCKSLSVGEHILFSDHNPVSLNFWNRHGALKGIVELLMVITRKLPFDTRSQKTV